MNSQAKEITIRRRIAGIFNKREEDFASLREYNDYLEEVEDMTWNLIEAVNVPAIEAKISQYQEENAEQIMISKARKAEVIAASNTANRGRNNLQGDNGMSLQNFQAALGQQGQYAPTLAGGQPRPTAQPVPIAGHTDAPGYHMEDKETMRLRAERGRQAGGWRIELNRERGFEEAFPSI